ncbi:ABC transporter ATP-binding protein [Thermoflexibacter ruber]|uniref:Iron complex transport system ATP-binding protein n=1 Tax=Thermoflexibacter ruber TaxID=1003 RepID=A0A1I2A367_9BACT|nr:ABC transporter ATP-binding protein [Thermoflexibacter ruber]SFE38236.1 iron complex transport system ATP-binding protein [Thermoflexibacter ruber]
MHLLHTSGLSVGYRTKKQEKILLDDLHLHLEQGKLTALLGINGTGKSTLLRTLAGLQPSLSGQVCLEGKDLAKIPRSEVAQKISLVLTDKPEINLMKVKDLVSLGRYPYLGWAGKLTTFDKEKIDQAMQITQITTWAEQKVYQLSDGQQQKVWIARALAQNTPLLFLDEPTAHLDVINRLEILLLLKKIAEQQQKAILIATHDLSEVLQVAHEIWLINKEKKLISANALSLIEDNHIEKNFTNASIYFDRENKRFKLKTDA